MPTAVLLRILSLVINSLELLRYMLLCHVWRHYRGHYRVAQPSESHLIRSVVQDSKNIRAIQTYCIAGQIWYFHFAFSHNALFNNPTCPTLSPTAWNIKFQTTTAHYFCAPNISLEPYKEFMYPPVGTTDLRPSTKSLKFSSVFDVIFSSPLSVPKSLHKNKL